MWNGFYNINVNSLGERFSTENLKEFFTEAIILSDRVHVDELRSGSWSRVASDMLPEVFVNTKLSQHSHNVVVNRFVYNGSESWADKVAEIGSSINNYYIFIYLSIENLELLVTKWNLTKKEI